MQHAHTRRDTKCGRVAKKHILLAWSSIVGFFPVGLLKTDDTHLLPVQLEVKEQYYQGNRLYVVVALTKIEANVMEEVEGIQNESNSNLLMSASTYNIAEIFKNINTNDYRLIFKTLLSKKACFC